MRFLGGAFADFLLHGGLNENTFRFLLGNLYDFVPREHAVHIEDLHSFDLWLSVGVTN
jgi:isoleucyl-tRNA synthetase